jgi:hypothetical protein
MLSQIMNLAGVKPVGHADMPAHDSGEHPLTSEPGIQGTPHDEKEVMRSTMDMMNPPEDEGAMGGAVGAGLGAMVGGPLGAAAGGAIGGAMEDEGEPDAGGPVAAMADEIRDMADELSQVDDKDELNVETYDNTPADPNKKPEFDSNKLAWNPNAGGHGGNGLANNPRAMSETLEDQLFAEYKAFVNEGEQKTMSRAAKGNEKYGKEGMKALAKAGKEGKSLDKVRAKYDKYN